jgi:hypothetical protein
VDYDQIKLQKTTGFFGKMPLLAAWPTTAMMCK